MISRVKFGLILEYEADDYEWLLIRSYTILEIPMTPTKLSNDINEVWFYLFRMYIYTDNMKLNYFIILLCIFSMFVLIWLSKKFITLSIGYDSQLTGLHSATPYVLSFGVVRL